MSQSYFKFLTLTSLILSIFCLSSYAQSLLQEDLKTYLRWTIKIDKSKVEIEKLSDKLILKTLDLDTFNRLSEEILKNSRNDNYILDYKMSKNDLPSNPATIEIYLKDKSIEVFSFYKDAKSELNIDFWNNASKISDAKTSEVKPELMTSSAPKIIKKTEKKSPKIVKKINVEKSFKPLAPEVLADEAIAKNGQAGYRDFRYGAIKIWEYPAYIPPVEKDVDLSLKAPDYFYTIKNRENIDDPKEAHLQLTINFFNKKDYGLMTRSINLYEEKYGRDSNTDLNDFMKATSLLRNNIKEYVKATKGAEVSLEGEENVPKKDVTKKGIHFAAMNMLSNIVERTNDYELKQACLRFVLQDALDKGDYINALQLAKKLYVASTEAFDDTMIIYSSKAILSGLAHLGQLDKLNEFMSNKAVMRVLPKQEGLAYATYIELTKGIEEEVVKVYEANAASLNNFTHPAIMFNVAEAYFRLGQYEKALKLFDRFNLEYSFLPPASATRLRMAIIYDLLDKPIAETIKLYEGAINRATRPEISFEAKLRYVGIRLARKLNADSDDSELMEFFHKNDSEKGVNSPDLNQLLWSVRIRSFLSLKQYDEAMAYLSTLPLDTISPADRHIFHLDGAEIALGIMQKSYFAGEFARAVKTWEIYKERYKEKMGNNPYSIFIVADSYLNLGLKNLFNKTLQNLKFLEDKDLIRSFPKWVVPHKEATAIEYATELALIGHTLNKDWEKLSNALEEVPADKREKINYDYYHGLIEYNKGKYETASGHFESLIIKSPKTTSLNPAQTNNLLVHYVESLYRQNDQSRFRKNASALLKDVSLQKNQNKDIVERVSYLYLESLLSEKEVNYNECETRGKEFVKTFGDKSQYKHRVNYIIAKSMAELNKTDEAKVALRSIVDSKETPEYLKALAKTDLATLSLVEKKI